MRFAPGDTVGPYRVTGNIGEGAMGVVYQVVNGVTGRLEAMKVLTDDVSNDLQQVERFLHEIQLQAKLEHPHIAQVRTAFCEGRRLIMIMEQVDGESLDRILARSVQAPIMALRIMEQVLLALSYAHSKGVIHRDVKPANVIVAPNGQVKLTDFGLARQQSDPSKTLPGIAVGTVFYMSPEQVRAAGPVDGRSDLYSAGVIFYEMLTGRRPFDGEEQFAVMRAQVEHNPAPPSAWNPVLPPAVDLVLARALGKDPAHRFQSADEFLAAIRTLPSAWMAPAVKPKRSLGPLKFGAVMCGTAILVLSAFALPPWLARQEPEIEVLQLSPPPAPKPPADALSLPRWIEPAPERPVVARVPVAVRQRPLARFAATRISNAEPAEVVDAPPAPVVVQEKFPEPPRLTILPQAPLPAAPLVPAQPKVEPPPKAQEPNWMRRTVRGFPRIFRRRNETKQQ
ncbi:MAG: serine/threonine protein kinase [Acidobacteria bacterium]|nr:serine/threonine protein kinase [Acidobacteriota bacterium]